MTRKLKQGVLSSKRPAPVQNELDVLLAELTLDHQLEYQVRKRETVGHAKKREAILLNGYRKWLRDQDRRLNIVKYKSLRCDAYEEERNNLIEAKSSAEREHLRMAVGQLLDYSHLGRRHFRDPNKAILLPTKPDSEAEAWLSSLRISIIWRKRRAFLDNANSQFS